MTDAGSTGHRGNRSEPRWAALEWAVREGRPVMLTPDQCRDIILWANEVTADKNAVVRENHVPEARP